MTRHYAPNKINAERFWARIERRGPDECWPWMARRNVRGYGRARWDGRYAAAHRVVWAMANGPIPPGLFVLHSCDNPPCCNPAHLHIGTHADNMAEMVSRGRAAPPQGEASPNAKLTAEDVRRIRSLYPSRSLQSLADDYGLGKSSIKRVVTRETWAHVE